LDTSEESQPESNDIIRRRIESFFRILRDVKEETQKSKIRGLAEYNFKRLILGIADSLETELKNTISEISEITDQTVKIHRSGAIHLVFEDFLYEVDAIIRQSQQIPDELHYFVGDMLSRLKESSNARYILICGPDLSTANFSHGLIRLFHIFPEAQEYINSTQRFLWEISIPPFLLTNPIDWPMVIHEIGHIIEDQFLKSVDKYYYASEILAESDIRYRYAKEFQADYIATCLMGPVFGVRVLINYFTREIRISATHPAWKERLDAIEEYLKSMMQSFPEYKEMSAKLPPEKALIGRDRIEHLPCILSETFNHIKDAVYQPSSTEEEKAFKRLIRFAPYTDDIRILLNVSEKAKKYIISEGVERELVEREFPYLLRDAIRMSYLKKFFASVFNKCS